MRRLARLHHRIVRRINNVVDITNYCLYELGEPLHAFDADTLAPGGIVIRRAKASEKIVTIDGQQRQLNAGVLVIADQHKPVAVAGVMGGMDTEVGNTTTTVLLEDAFFSPLSVRTTSRNLSLPSEASFRFCRIVDIENESNW